VSVATQLVLKHDRLIKVPAVDVDSFQFVPPSEVRHVEALLVATHSNSVTQERLVASKGVFVGVDHVAPALVVVKNCGAELPPPISMIAHEFELKHETASTAGEGVGGVNGVTTLVADRKRHSRSPLIVDP
jgi:hypothetical protein